MIINLNQFGSGGGSGSGYTLPIASDTTLGGVKIGDGINIDSAGTISTLGDSTVLQSVSALPLTSASGNIYSMANIVSLSSFGFVLYDGDFMKENFNYAKEKQIKIVKGNVLPSEQTQFISFYDIAGDWTNVWYNTNGTFDLYNGNAGWNHEVVPSSGIVYDDGWMRAEFMPDSTGLTITMSQDNQINVDYSYPVSSYFDNELYIWNPNSGTCAEIKKGANGSYAIAYYGELPQNEPLIYSEIWGEYKYVFYEGNDEFGVYGSTGKTDQSYSFRIGELTSINDPRGFVTATKGLITLSLSLGKNVGLYGDWYIKNAAHFQPVNWLETTQNLIQKTEKVGLTTFELNGQSGSLYLGENMLNIYTPDNGGSFGQILTATGGKPVWDNAPLQVNFVDSLPFASDNNSICILNTHFNKALSTAFVAKNSISYDSKNNFSENDELTTWDYLYFGLGDYSGTSKTYLYRIGMRRNGWNNEKAYAYVSLDYNTGTTEYEYKVEYDFTANNVHYQSAITIGVSETAETETFYNVYEDYAGYKFKFEVDSSSNLTLTLESGEGYGDVAAFIGNTKDFYNVSDFSQYQNSIYYRLGGVWYNLGLLSIPS